jgi:CubicO group peptidase (beta-lactamase class C family)
MYNTGAQVLGVLASRATGQPIDEAYRSRLFEPLGMADTGFWTAETQRLATGYRPSPDGLVAWDEPDGQWSRRPAFADGAAGLLSTAGDLYAFGRMLLDGGAPVLATDDVRAMTRDQLTPQQRAYGGLGPDFFSGQSWGFCQMVHDDGSFGWDGGLGTSWLVDPARDLVMVVLTQRMFDSPATPQVHRDIQAAARAALG